jgi:3-hydroxyisobutyrate dehydrogenase-like beta-hydroxyacid dehydrogenase
MNVGYIGLGDLGAPMAERILQHGHSLLVWNRTRAKMMPIVAAGATATESPADLGSHCEIVCICVDSARAVEHILFAPEGLANALPKPRLIVDHSTIHPRDAVQISDKLRALDIAMIDAPVSGGAAGARAGSLVVMAGGTSADVEAAQPVLAAYAQQVTHMGPIGSGQAAKACNQIINFGTIACIAEAFAVGSAYGLEMTLLPKALAGGLADSNMLREYVRGASTGDKPHMTLIINRLVALFGGRLEAAAGGTMHLVLKDLGIANELARSQGTVASGTSLVENWFRLLLRPNTPRAALAEPS